MVEAKSVPERSSKLSAADRLILIQTLNALPHAQFEELLVALNPPNGNIPTNTAPQANRSAALFQWVESPIGPGIPELEALLGKIIATHSKTAREFVSFAISGKIDNSTVTEVRAIVELLRKKTGDNSIDVAFFREGSIKLILSGSPEGLEKLQELFESGELEDLETPPIEDVHQICDNTTDARKAQLIKTLKLRKQALINILNLANDLPNDLDLNLANAFDLANDLANDHSLDLANTLGHSLDLAKALPKTFARVNALDLVLDLANTLSRAFTLALELARVHANPNALALALNLVRARALALDFTLALDLVFARSIDLTNANFRGSNLRDIDLSEANLTDADLTDADVTGTIFGDNLGLTEADKQDLQRRGAILLDPPSSDVPSLALR